jgi:hypothetical protein
MPRPKTLQTEGRKLWNWTVRRFNTEGLEPLLGELCQLADRLGAVRSELHKTLDPRLIAAEVKLIAQYTRAWKLLGLADSDVAKGRPGRPVGVPARKKGVA